MSRRLTLFLVLASSLTMPSAALARQETTTEAGVVAGSGESHLFFGATARSLPPGHGYFGVREIGFGAFQIGITNRFSFGAGTVLAYPKVAVITPKYQVYQGKDISAAVGVAHLVGARDFGLGAAYGAVTKEFKSGSLTTGGGVLYARDDHKTARVGVAMIGGERRLSSRVIFVTENYVFFAGGAVASAGVRLVRGRFATDLGLIAPIFEGPFIPGPVVNFGWTF